MRTLPEDRVDPNDLVTTGEAARLLNASRQHIVDLCEAGDLPYVTTGTHRRIRRGDLEQVRSRTQRLTRDQRRSLWLSHAVAGKLVTDPDLVLAIARDNLTNLQAVHKRGQAARWLDEWGQLLNGPIDKILDALTSRSQRSRELRQNSPFSTVLTEEERRKVLNSISAVERRGQG